MKLIDQDIGQYVYKHMCIRYIHVYINSAMSLLISFIAFPAEDRCLTGVVSVYLHELCSSEHCSTQSVQRRGSLGSSR